MMEDKMETSISIPVEEYSKRVDRLVEIIQAEKLTGIVLFDNYYILYYTGFAFIPTERPIAFVLNSSGERALFVPRLEVEHAKANSLIQRVEHYREYPYQPHPMMILKDMLVDMGITGEIGVDSDGYPWILGYRGPEMSELMDSKTRKITGFIEDQMMVKSDSELALIRESVKWGHLAHVFCSVTHEWALPKLKSASVPARRQIWLCWTRSGQFTGLKAHFLMVLVLDTGVKSAAMQLSRTLWQIILSSRVVTSW
jgi:hypothetical protein